MSHERVDVLQNATQYGIVLYVARIVQFVGFRARGTSPFVSYSHKIVPYLLLTIAIDPYIGSLAEMKRSSGSNKVVNRAV